jgi:hypothetical protein
MYQIKLQAELADLLVQEGWGEERSLRRSGLVEVLIDGSQAAAVVIGLLQGPLTAMQWIDLIKRWRVRQQDNVPKITISSGDISASFPVTSDPEVRVAADAIVQLIAAQQDDRRTNEADDVVI